MEASLEPVWYLYLLECADGSLYAGITLDVERRFREHRAGRGGRYTRSHPPLRVAASCAVGAQGDALRAELALKRLPKAQKLAAVQSRLFEPT